jgi:hypothetical protein
VTGLLLATRDAIDNTLNDAIGVKRTCRALRPESGPFFARVFHGDSPGWEERRR